MTNPVLTQRLGCRLWWIMWLLLASLATQADYRAPLPVPDRYAQILLGSQPVDQSWYLYQGDSGAVRSAEVRSIHSLGYFAQLPKASGWIQYGTEWGGHLGYDSRRYLELALGGDGSYLSIDSRMWTGDFSAGGFVSIAPLDRVRVYAAMGPLVYWGQLRRGEGQVYNHSGNDGQAAVAGGGYVIDSRRYRYDLGAAFYARVGLEFMVVQGYTLGVSARRTTTELDFGASGYVELDGVAYMLTFGGTF